MKRLAESKGEDEVVEEVGEMEVVRAKYAAVVAELGEIKKTGGAKKVVKEIKEVKEAAKEVVDDDAATEKKAAVKTATDEELAAMIGKITYA